MRLSIKTTIAIAVLVSLPSLVVAKEIKTNTAQMQAMDKVTGKVQVIEVPVNGNVNFGTFSILVRDCQTRPPEETPENFSFVDIVDNNSDGTKHNIFKGWMMSSTPALNAIEHPIYDVWLLKCINKDIDKSLLLSKEELEARNDIKKLVENKPQSKEGEPTNLLANIAKDQEEDTEKNVVQEEMPTLVPAQEIEKKDQIIIKGITPDEDIISEDNNVIYENFQPQNENVIINDDVVDGFSDSNEIDAPNNEDELDEQENDNVPKSLIKLNSREEDSGVVIDSEIIENFKNEIAKEVEKEAVANSIQNII